MVRFAWLLIVLLAASASVVLARRMPHDAVAPQAEAKPVAPHSEPVGSVGCSAAACHGLPDARALTEAPQKHEGWSWKVSSTIYHAIDPHRNAFDVLRSPLGKKIYEGIKGKYFAESDARCLACHVNPSLAKAEWKFYFDDHPGPEGVKWIQKMDALSKEGVSCEACHGNASLWKAEHTAWNDKTSDEEKQSRGFNVRLYKNRAAICAGCHVGAPAGDGPVRDMNHDMIAAGHPRIDNKSFAELKADQPQHFLAKPNAKDDAGAFAFALKALSEDRRQRALAGDVRTPWPEFAGMDCKTCHHALKAK